MSIEEMKYIIDGKLVVQGMTTTTYYCTHKIVQQAVEEMIGDTQYRYCEVCGMVAHEDGRFHYVCGMDYCRCMS